MPNLPSELWKWDAVDLAKAIRMGAVSSRDAVAACLERLDSVNPKLNAVVRVHREEALKAAAAADSAVKRGDTLGPLHGIPVTIKDNIDQAGQPTGNGVGQFQSLIAKDDSPVVANWRRAGAVVIGRTNAPAFSSRWDTDNAPHGRTFQPWSKRRTAGGSSGGAASALAAGIGPLAHGNDIGGSIRYPAYCCGVAGIRPTMGRVPAFNGTASIERTPTSILMAVQGPLARRIRDVRLGLDAMAQGDPRDPLFAPAPIEGPPPKQPIKVALVTQAPGQFFHPAVADAIRRAGAALADAGYAVEEATPPGIDEAAATFAKLLAADVRSLSWETMQKYGDPDLIRSQRLFLADIPEVTLAEYQRAIGEMMKHRRAWSLFMEQHPLVVAPNSGELPFEIGFDLQDADGTHRLMAAQRLMVVVNLLGFPSAAVPVGTASAPDAPQGLPTGVQIVARPFREDLALAAAEIVEARHGLATPIDPVF